MDYFFYKDYPGFYVYRILFRKGIKFLLLTQLNAICNKQFHFHKKITILVYKIFYLKNGSYFLNMNNPLLKTIQNKEAIYVLVSPICSTRNRI